MTNRILIRFNTKFEEDSLKRKWRNRIVEVTVPAGTHNILFSANHTAPAATVTFAQSYASQIGPSV